MADPNVRRAPVRPSPEQYFIKAPVLMLVEAKNEDMKRGYAQCIAEMLGAQTFNAREGDGSRVRISTVWDGAGGIGGFFERLFAPRVMRGIYDDELERLDAHARGSSPA